MIGILTGWWCSKLIEFHVWSRVGSSH